MTENLCVNFYKDRTFADVTFVFDGKEEKAHKCVLADRCDHFKQLFNQTNSNVINMDKTSLKIFKELVKFCYLQHVEIADWSYDDKQCLYEIATEYKYGPLTYFVKRELDKRPEVPLSLDTLNEWYKSCPQRELRDWIKNNILNITNFDDCYQYTKDLILFILDTFNEMFDEESNNVNKLRTEQKKLLQWLFRWRNWSNRDEEDVRSLLSKARLQLVLQKRTLRHKRLQKETFIESNDGLFLMPVSFAISAKYETAVKDFLRFKKLDTNGWTCEEILHLLGCAKEYEFGPLFDAVLNVVATQHLDPSSLTKIYDIARQLESSKLQEVIVDYLRNNTNSIFTSAEFMDYPARVVGIILDSLQDQVIRAGTECFIIPSIKMWMDLSSKKGAIQVYNNIKWLNFIEKVHKFRFFGPLPLLSDFEKLSKSGHMQDVTCMIGERKINAHKILVAYSYNSSEQPFDQNQVDRINMETTHILLDQPINRSINPFHGQRMVLTGWDYSKKKHLYDLATKHNCRLLIDLVQIELEKRPKVRLSAASLNEWYGNCPDEEIREWVKKNQLNIVNYEDCHKYSTDLVVFIMNTFHELSLKATDKQNPQKKLLLWLFRWTNSAIRKEEDVQSLFEKIRLPLVFKDRSSKDKTLQKKVFEAVRRFCQTREVDTAGWTCDDVLDLLFVAFDNEFGPLVDAVVNVLDTQYTRNLKPASLVNIHHLMSRLESNKLQEIMSGFIKTHIMLILTSAEFLSYPPSLVLFILDNVRSQLMDVNVKNQLLTSLWNWKTSKSENELKAVFTKIQWEDFTQQQLAGVLRLVIPTTCLADISGPLAPAEGKGAKRKLSNNSQRRRRGRPRKE